MSDRTNKKLTCPTCSTSFYMEETDSPPFCCERCKMVDLGRWLDEEHGLPHEGDPGDTPVEHRIEAED